MILTYNGNPLEFNNVMISEPVKQVIQIWTNDCTQADNLGPDTSGWYLTGMHDSNATVVLNENGSTAATDIYYSRFELDDALDCSGTGQIFCSLECRARSSGTTVLGIELDSSNPVLVISFEDASGNTSSWAALYRKSSTELVYNDPSVTSGSVPTTWATLASTDFTAICGNLDLSAIKAVRVNLISDRLSGMEWKTRRKAISFNKLIVSDSPIEGKL